MPSSIDELTQSLRELRSTDNARYDVFEAGMRAALGSITAAAEAIEDVLAAIRAES